MNKIWIGCMRFCGVRVSEAMINLSVSPELLERAVKVSGKRTKQDLETFAIERQ